MRLGQILTSKAELSAQIGELTGLANPTRADEDMATENEHSLNKDKMADLLQQAAGTPAEGVLRLRQQLAKSSTAKIHLYKLVRGRQSGLFPSFTVQIERAVLQAA